MANADQIKALIESHSDGDDSRFYSIAMQVAARAAKSGHARLALELRELVDEAKARKPAPSRPGPIPIQLPRGELAGLLTATYPKVKLGELVLPDDLRARLGRVLREQRSRDKLKFHGFEPQRKLLLVGPPGVGKSMSASALATELSLPLFTIQLDGLITKFMGETAAKLRLIFDQIRQTRAVYLFDEFDAIGTERGGRNDVGEMRRVLNSFLQFIEGDDSDAVFIAATNHVHLLDRALFRRFDTRLDYELPSADLAIEVMRNRLAMMDTESIAWPDLKDRLKGLSHAEVVRAADQAAKDSILEGTEVVRTEQLLVALEDRQAGLRKSEVEID